MQPSEGPLGSPWPHLIYKRAHLEKRTSPNGGSSMGCATLPGGPLGSPGPIYCISRATWRKGHRWGSAMGRATLPEGPHGVSWPHLIYKRAYLEKGHHPTGAPPWGVQPSQRVPLGLLAPSNNISEATWRKDIIQRGLLHGARNPPRGSPGVSWPHLIYKRAYLEKGHHPTGAPPWGTQPSQRVPWGLLAPSNI